MNLERYDFRISPNHLEYKFYSEGRAEGFQYTPAKVDPTMEDHSNDPVVIQRTEEAKKLLEKVKFPPNWRDME